MQMIQSREGEADSIEQGGGKQESVQQYFCHVTIFSHICIAYSFLSGFVFYTKDAPNLSD